MTERDTILEEIDEEILTEEEEQTEITDEEKEAEKRKKAEELWIDVQSGNTKHLITKVASILNRFPETRNSDVALMIKFWEVFEGHKGNFISVNKLFRLERLTSVARTRAKVQNEYGLFLADERVRRYRQSREESQREFQIATKPPMESISVFADESGKNDEFAIVGSIWILAREGELNGQIVDWIQDRKQEDQSCPNEFHFNKIRNNGTNLQVYKDFIDFVVGNGHMIGFKAIAVNKTKINKPIDEIITELFYQLVRVGVEHEKNTGRIDLPKQITYMKDAEEGESALRLSQIQQSLVDNFKIHYDQNLKLNAFMSIDSKMNRFIQIADLFTGAINRKINHQRKNPNTTNAKDEFASYVYELINIEELSYPTEHFTEVSGQDASDLATLYIFD
ncbi:DUF3800 domain-containing protein [Priestia megaterium]|uniref:DUF3800 domain-containing protein n=1 Tax=Priestia megaterium TaxID=1404 RepID=UPI003000384D